MLNKADIIAHVKSVKGALSTNDLVTAKPESQALSSFDNQGRW